MTIVKEMRATTARVLVADIELVPSPNFAKRFMEFYKRPRKHNYRNGGN